VSNLLNALLDATAYLTQRGIDLPEGTAVAIKRWQMAGKADQRRDAREPGAIEKALAEEELQAIFERVLKAQLVKLRAYLEVHYPNAAKQAPTVTLFDWADFADEWELMLDLLSTIYGQGAASLGVTAEQVDGNWINERARAWAEAYAYDLIRGIAETSRDVVATAVEDFVRTPGRTVGQVISALEPTFGAARAKRIAVTEITRAYAEGQMELGIELQRRWPNIPVVKRWFTNNDDLVCEICGPLDTLLIPFDEPFVRGDSPDGVDITNPPAHVNCRCWMSVTTNLSGVATGATNADNG
jgi:hypothetical protein